MKYKVNWVKYSFHCLKKDYYKYNWANNIISLLEKNFYEKESIEFVQNLYYGLTKKKGLK